MHQLRAHKNVEHQRMSAGTERPNILTEGCVTESNAGMRMRAVMAVKKMAWRESFALPLGRDE
jgi:hypothetical protein